MPSYADTPHATPYWDFFNFDQEWQQENDRFYVFAKRMLGGSVLQVELTQKDIWSCYERALLKYGQILNEYKTKYDSVYFFGLKPQDDIRYELVQPAPNFNYIDKFAQQLSIGAGLAGNYESKYCYINLVRLQQDYDLKEELYGPDNTLLYDSLDPSEYNRIRIMTVFHFPPWLSYRFFNSNSLMNYLNNEFRFESFTPETMFYVLPVADDALRMGMQQLSNKVRRSNYSYEISGRIFRVLPIPVLQEPGKIFMKVSIMPTALGDDAIFGDINNGGRVSGPSTIPFKNLVYQDIKNDAGRNWIREYGLALCKELLGMGRTKFTAGIPLADRDIQMNGSELLSQSKEEKDKLETKIVELLDEVSSDKILERQVLKAENLKKYLELTPIPPKSLFKIG